MRASDFLSQGAKLKTYIARLKLKQTGYVQQIDTTVVARNPEQARRMIKQLYGDKTVMIGQPRLVA